MAPAGETYQAWVRHGKTWTSLGTARPDANGNARLIVEGPGLAVLPDALRSRASRRVGTSAPTDR